MIRLVYSLVFYLTQPLVWMRLAWRARKQPEYLQHVGERYGFHAQKPPAHLLWLHAVSVGVFIEQRLDQRLRGARFSDRYGVQPEQAGRWFLRVETIPFAHMLQVFGLLARAPGEPYPDERLG